MKETIIFESNKRYPPGSTTNNLWFVFREGAEFGYQLGYEEAMKEIAKHPLAHLLLFDPMASESKEPKP